jgi:hypothetical protein
LTAQAAAGSFTLPQDTFCNLAYPNALDGLADSVSNGGVTEEKRMSSVSPT